MPYVGCHSPIPGHAARMTLHHSSGILPLLHELRAENVNFLLGSLDGSSLKMEYLKTYLSDILFALSNRIYAMFNVISFSNKITKWCNCPVRISPENVAVAVSWIKTLPSDNGVDIQTALAEAFQDPACQAVVLITDTLPDHMLQDICEHASRIGKGRPLHILHLSSGGSSDDGRSGLVGAFEMVSLQPADNSCEVSACQPSCSLQHYSPPETHTCSTHLMGLPEAHIPLCGLSISHNAPLADALMKRDFLNVPTETLRLLRGARVLARRATDGYYYLGHIAQEVEGSVGHFLVEFEKCQKQKGKAQLRMQETALYDIIHYEDARRQPIVPGDRVLAPLDVRWEPYGPGKVLQGVECRGFASDAQSSGVLVTFWNGHTRQVPPGVAVRIPVPLSDRIILELQMPPSARQKLVECSPGYPCSVPPGYRSSGGCGQAVCAHDAPWTQPCGTLSPTQSCQVSSTVWPGWSKEQDPIPSSSPKADKANRKNAEGVNMKKEYLPESSTRKEKKKKKKQRVESSRERLPENHLKMSQDSREIRSILTSSAVNSLEAVSQRKDGHSHAHGSPSQHSADVPEDYLLLSDSELSEVSNLQAVLKQIDLSLKKDRLLMESALPDRRPRSAPNSQRIIWNSRKPDEQKRRIMAAKAEEWKRQEEERRLQKEQELEAREQLLRQWELDIREQLQRQKSPQRSQEFERQDHESTFQPMKLDGAMKVYRSMQKKDVHEQEDDAGLTGRPGHKVQHLKTLQNSRDELDTPYSQRTDVSAKQTKKEMLKGIRQSDRSHSVPKELERNQSVQHISKSSASRGSVRFPQEMEPEIEMPRSRRRSPEHLSASKDGEGESNLHHFSPYKAMKGSLRFSQDMEQAGDSQRGRKQGPQHKFQSKLNDRESEQDMFHMPKTKTTQESGHAFQKTEQDIIRNRRQSPQHRSQGEDLSREQNLRPSSPQKATRGSSLFTQGVEQDIEMLRDRRWSPHHQFQNKSQDLDRNQTQHHPSKSKATQGLGKMSQEMELASEMLRGRRKSPQYKSDTKNGDQEDNQGHSKHNSPRGSGLWSQEMESVSEMLRSRKQGPQHRFESEPQVTDRERSLLSSSKVKTLQGSKHTSPEMEQINEMLRNRMQSSQKKFDSKSQELDREQSAHHSAYHTPTRGSKQMTHGSKPGSERDPARSWQRGGRDPAWPYSMLA
ncbi:uncharacterized protein LOC144769376 [Lissotriton helveticus]